MKHIIWTDTHFCDKKGDALWLRSQMKFIDNTFIPYIRNCVESNESFDIIHCGDFFEYRSTIYTHVAHELDKRLAIINELCARAHTTMYVLGGNHDYFSPETDEICFVERFLERYDNITTICHKSLIIDNVAFMPWYEFENVDVVCDVASRVNVIFTHCDVNEINDERARALKNKRLYAGHIHQPHVRGTWYNLGSTFCKDGNDANRKACAYVLNDDYEMSEKIENTDSINFYKLMDVPSQAIIESFAEHDRISLVLTAQQQEDNKELIKSLKEKYGINVLMAPKIENTRDVNIDVAMSLDEIALEHVPERLRDKYKRIVEMSLVNE